MNNINFEDDIKNNSEINIDTINSLCIMNKYLSKYSKITDMKKFPESLSLDLNKALSYQPMYLNIL